MADTSHLKLPIADEFSTGHVRDHLQLMQRFQRILDDIKHPQKHADWFPKAPNETVNADHELMEAWRVQCFLMNAEVRYSLYLRFLNGWVVEKDSKVADKENWPLPPWDVALIFYAHVLMPYRFFHEVGRAFPKLWEAGIEFPLSRLVNAKSKAAFEASEAAWGTTPAHVTPGAPYHVIEFDPIGEHVFLTGPGALDIRGHLCRSWPCLDNDEGPQVIPAADWSDARLGKRPFVCGRCDTSPTGSQPFTGPSFHAFSQIAFGVEIWELWESPLRQLGPNGFIETILKLVDTSETALRHAQHRYVKFLQIMKTASSISVPTVDIDLFWHTHQLTPIVYETYCVTHLDRKIYHDDSIASSPRHDALHLTKVAWITAYEEQFLDPDNPLELAAIAARKAAYLQKHNEYTTRIYKLDAEIATLTSQYNALQKPYNEAYSAHSRASHEASKLRLRIDQITRDERKVPRLRLFKYKYYTKTGKRALSALQAEKLSLQQQIADGKDHLAELKREEYRTYQERAASLRARESVRANKRRLERERDTAVGEAKRAISSTVVDSPLDDGKGGLPPVYSVVGTEAEAVVHVVGDGGDYSTVVSWYESWKGKGFIPPVLGPQGAKLLKPYGEVEGMKGVGKKWGRGRGSILMGVDGMEVVVVAGEVKGDVMEGEVREDVEVKGADVEVEVGVVEEEGEAAAVVAAAVEEEEDAVVEEVVEEEEAAVEAAVEAVVEDEVERAFPFLLPTTLGNHLNQVMKAL
ncbi:hypothetical protein B0T16DRAFT_490509 [Cercophora newfieldiana]|uniref:Uncharacterized protein n=1 Tax=Cercophora newfieldiana TaxID=92897 RepID=A0AA39YJG9_9PEZI|nr:hypothetical protein B0T16DRAFT_490509 [Cercophora newfieldiana]